MTTKVSDTKQVTAEKATAEKATAEKATAEKATAEKATAEKETQSVRYICIYPCQVRMPDKRIKFFRRGDTQAFPEGYKVPDTFEEISNIVVDFDESSEAELLHGNFDAQELRNYLHQKYNRTVSTSDKELLVRELIDARYRATDARYELRS